MNTVTHCFRYAVSLLALKPTAMIGLARTEIVAINLRTACNLAKIRRRAA